jgi:predicted enzyme related to lactoylglutathione lyase
VFGIYKSFNRSIAWDGQAVIGRFSWHELMTTDHVAAAKFYDALFGWPKISEVDMGGGEMYYMFGQKGNMYGGMFTTPAEMAGMHPFWLVYINVKDVGKAVEIATKAGATVQRPQMDIPGGSIAILADPQGAGYAVHHVTVPAEAPKPAPKPAPKTAATKTAATKTAATKTASTKKAVKTAAKKAAPARRVAKAKTRAKPKAKAKAKAKSNSRPATRARTTPRKKAAPAARRKGKAKAKK